MLLRWIRPIRFLVEGIVAADTPRQLALGLALGMVIGLVPKGNLTAIALSTILLATPVNLATGLLGAALFSWLNGWTDPLAHRVGYALLTHEPLRPLFAWFFSLAGRALDGLEQHGGVWQSPAGNLAFLAGLSSRPSWF